MPEPTREILAALRQEIAAISNYDRPLHRDRLLPLLLDALDCVEALEIQKKAWMGVVERELDGPLVDFAEAQIKRIDAALASFYATMEAKR